MRQTLPACQGFICVGKKIKIKNQQVNLILRLASVCLDIDDSGCGSVLAQGYLPARGGYNEN